jgi:arabinogalactan oligomer / maltooligosaccharide transport system substrate-binding protein
MNKNMKKAAAVLTTAGLMAGLLAGCASSSAPGQKPAQNAAGHAKIVIWSYWKEQELDALKSVADAWAKQTGNEVVVQVDNESQFQAFATAARSGKGPDILFGLPHDNLGTFQKAGLLAELPAKEINDSDYEDVSLKAVTVDGKRVAFPMSMETYGMFYNTDKVKTAPKTWSEFIDVASKQGFMYDINNFYFSYAFLSGEGGYVFKDNNGTYDTNDIGLGNAGAVKGYSILRDFVQKYKFMPADVTGDIAKSKFTSKNTGLYITGPWDVMAFKKAGVNVGVAPLPTLEDGNQPKNFVGVQTGIVSTKSQNQQAAWDLLKYISENGGSKFLEVGARIPVLKKTEQDPSFKNNAIATGIAQIAAQGEPMPNIPAIQAVWTPVGNNFKLLTSGKADPNKVATDVVAQVKQGIATQQ